ncbi:MAG: CHC2 zinc finger domain-containing protein, partial [Candidatus Aenigmarchaeota archaeon]|nr:CHC2 zinc finger domain-containing protein [Candidatus Aenigmarchaeota archaeon]
MKSTKEKEMLEDMGPQKTYYENLVAASDIIEVAEELIPEKITDTTLTKLFCDCPHHVSTSKKSLEIDGEKQLWYCWGCKKGGGVIRLVEFLETGEVSECTKGPQTSSHRKARDYLAKRANLPMLGHSELDPEHEEALQHQKLKDARTYECLTWISEYYNRKLEQNQEVLDWFSNNYAISSKTISGLKIGYSDNEGVLEDLESSDFSTEEILSTGAFIESAFGATPLFRNRILFPYWSKGKGVVYMIGRKTPWTPEDKYESGKYKKLLVHNEKHSYVGACINNSMLYNEDCLSSSPEMIVITEGVTDVISAMERGFNAISPVTVRIKKTDLDRICGKLNGYSGKIVIVQDNEISKVGLKGAMDNARELSTRGFDARIAELPLSDKQKKARTILQEKFGLDLSNSPEELANQINKFTKKDEEEEIELLKKQSKIDINDFFKDGNSEEDFQKLLDGSVSPLELLIDSLDPDCGDSGTLNTISEILSDVSSLNHVGQEFYLKKIKTKLPNTTLGALKQTMKSVTKERAETPKHDNPLNLLLGLFYDSGSTAFIDELGEGWITTKCSNHYENISIHSPRFIGIMLKKYHDTYKDGVSPEIIKQLGILLKEGSTEKRYLFNRFAWLDDRIWIDLGDPDWQVIEVTEDGWDIIQPDKPIFRKFSHQLPLPIPKEGGDIRKVFDYLSVKDEGNKALLLVWLCTCMLEHIPRPGIIFHGIQGSCKTSGAGFLRLLVDPSNVLHSSLSRDETQLSQFMDHHAVVSLDNISSLSKSVCDDLSRAITGAGHSKRALYTNNEDFIFKYKRVFILNGISIPTTAPDLLDRTLLIELSRL